MRSDVIETVQIATPSWCAFVAEKGVLYTYCLRKPTEEP